MYYADLEQFEKRHLPCITKITGIYEKNKQTNKSNYYDPSNNMATRGAGLVFLHIHGEFAFEKS